jgi:hypothetical protein
MGRLTESEKLHRRALSIDEAGHGPEEPTTAIDLNNLALLLKDMDRNEEVEALHRRALKNDQTKLGPAHFFTVAGNLSLRNVPPEIFVDDPARFDAVARSVSAGEIAFSIQDTGGVDLSIRQAARNSNISLEAARKTLIDNMTRNVRAQSSTRPELQQLVDATIRFIEQPSSTLRIELIPKS